MNQPPAPIAPVVPAWATHVLIIEPSGHLDWDWQGTFEQYYDAGAGGHTPVKLSFQHAMSLLANNSSYTYSICEQAYLQRFFQDFPDDVGTFRGYGERLSISGGGITSAENLICHGETFIRNYLVGRHWVRDTLGDKFVPDLWIPDDFGHDSQLPVTLRAMGYRGAAFWRIPGGDGKSGESYRTPQAPGSLLQGNIDFHWSGSDGSTIQAHWLWQGYCEGNNDLGQCPTPLCAIQTMVTTNLPAAITRYMFVPIDCDFNDPDSVSSVIQAVEDGTTRRDNTGSRKASLPYSGPTHCFPA